VTDDGGVGATRGDRREGARDPDGLQPGRCDRPAAWRRAARGRRRGRDGSAPGRGL